jgi:hypothetical protein
MSTAPWVTPRHCYTWQVCPGSTVLDTGRENSRCGAAASAGGDVGGREQVAMPSQITVWAGQDPPGRLGNTPGAARARGRGSPFVNEAKSYPAGFGLVPKRAQQVADPPGPSALVVPPPRVQAENAARVTDCHGANAVLHRPGDHLLGGFMLSLPDPPPVPSLYQPLTAPVLAPSPRSFLPRHGSTAGYRALPRLGIAQMQVILGADGPPRHQQCLAFWPGGRTQVDDPNIHSRQPSRVRRLTRGIGSDWHLGGHIYPESSRLVKQCYGPDLTQGIRDIPIQPQGQRWAAFGHWNPQPTAIQPKRTCIPAKRYQSPPATRVPRCGIP